MYNTDIKETLKKLLGGAGTLLGELAKYNKGKKTEKSGIIKEFEDMDKKLEEGFQKAVYDAPTDGEIKAAAERELALKYEGEKDKITDTIAKAYSSLEGKKESLSASAQEEKDKLDKYYEEEIKEAKNAAIKKGLARSSISGEQEKELARIKEEGRAAADNGLRQRLEEIEGEISKLAAQKEKAEKDLELNYAASIDKKINALKAERDKKAAETLKYNNEIEEKKQKYYRSKEGEGIVREIQEEKLAAAKKYYDGMPKQKALEEFIANEDMKKHLGPYYGYMLNYLNNR